MMIKKKTIQKEDVKDFATAIDLYELIEGEYKEIKALCSKEATVYYYEQNDGQFYAVFENSDIVGKEEEVVNFLKSFILV